MWVCVCVLKSYVDVPDSAFIYFYSLLLFLLLLFLFLVDVLPFSVFLLLLLV